MKLAKIIVFIDNPMVNTCDGEHYLSIISDPETFIIKIQTITIDGTNKKIPAKTWELNNDELVKR